VSVVAGSGLFLVAARGGAGRGGAVGRAPDEAVTSPRGCKSCALGRSFGSLVLGSKAVVKQFRSSVGRRRGAILQVCLLRS